MYRQMITRLKRGNTKGVFSNAKPIYIVTLIDFIPYLRENKLKGLMNCLKNYISRTL